MTYEEIKERLKEKLSEDFLFENFNDKKLREEVKQAYHDIMAETEYKWLVVCDETNNTPETIDNGEFHADFYLKNADEENFKCISFTVKRTAVSFDEIQGSL